MPKQYELTYTVKKNLAPEETDALFGRVGSLLSQTTSSEKGYDFFTLGFYSEPGTIQDLDKKLKSELQIKNYLITKKEKVRIVKARTRKAVEQAPAQEQKVAKVELKEIDEKLKEIFGE